MWLSDLLPQKTEIRPTRPTSENFVGRPQSIMAVAPPDTSDTSDTKKAKNILSGEKHQKEEGIAQVSSEKPESVRHLPLEEATPEQIAHARRMLVACPLTGGKLHCWHCSRCGDSQACRTWRTRRADVEFFRHSGPPYSLYLVEGDAVEVLQ